MFLVKLFAPLKFPASVNRNRLERHSHATEIGWKGLADGECDLEREQGFPAFAPMVLVGLRLVNIRGRLRAPNEASH